jgi:hypothetical protein
VAMRSAFMSRAMYASARTRNQPLCGERRVRVSSE